jgi:hypothetical protein
MALYSELRKPGFEFAKWNQEQSIRGKLVAQRTGPSMIHGVKETDATLDGFCTGRR